MPARTKTAKPPVEEAHDEHSADAAEAAKAIDAKAKASKAISEARSGSTNVKTIKRAVELYDSGMGLVKLTRQLTEEGHRSAHGKELRPQTVRQWLLKEKGVAKLGTRTK